MAGKPGRSGGARPGSGPPRAPRLLNIEGKSDPLDFLLAVMNDGTVEANLRLRAAMALLPYMHAKRREEVGKKATAQRAAARVVSGRFGPAIPPTLVVNNGIKK